MITLTVNRKLYRVDAAPETPLLWVLRDELRLTGTKYGCGKSLCGACTVHVDGAAVRSCITPVSAVAGKEITTIEGIPESHPVKQAWLVEDVPQCGWCQPGQIMAATALLAEQSDPNDKAIDAAMDVVLCRCGTYPRIRKAIRRAAALARERGAP